MHSNITTGPDKAGWLKYAAVDLGSSRASGRLEPCKYRRPKSRSRHELRSICGEKPKAKGVTRPFTPYIRLVQDERNPVSSL